MGKRPNLTTRREQEVYLCAFFQVERAVVLNSGMLLILGDAWGGIPPTLAIEYLSKHPDMRKYHTVGQWRRAHHAST
jgi:mannose/fructose-specific phosphotransferase system component IIA